MKLSILSLLAVLAMPLATLAAETAGEAASNEHARHPAAGHDEHTPPSATMPAVQAEDKRQIIPLTETQRHHLLTEMRALLSGMQQIVAALARNDMQAVAEEARPLGMGMAHKAEDHLQGALPKTFMQLGMSLHQDFDQIAVDAGAMKGGQHTLKQLSNAMAKCAACHGAYQLRTTGP